PVYALTVEPGERTESGAERGGDTFDGDQISAPNFYHDPNDEGAFAPTMAVDRSRLPEVGTISNFDFPAIERGKLSNGIEIVFARRASVPTVKIAVEFDAGYAADPKSALGTQSLMQSLLNEGTTTRSSIQIAEESERLGAYVGSNANFDRTYVSLDALTPNLAGSLDLLADICRNPAFDPSEVERLRAQ